MQFSVAYICFSYTNFFSLSCSKDFLWKITKNIIGYAILFLLEYYRNERESAYKLMRWVFMIQAITIYELKTFL